MNYLTVTTFFVIAIVAVGGALQEVNLVKTSVRAPRCSASIVLKAHNKYRKELGIAPLKWDVSLQRSSVAYARKLVRTNRFEHTKTRKYGENLWKGSGRVFTYTEMVRSWGSEKKFFKYGVNTFIVANSNWRQVGHYTQMIWRDTKRVGCGGAGSFRTGFVFVCHYKKPGNVRNRKVY